MLILNLDQEMLPPIQSGTYVLEYVSDGINANEKTMNMIFKVIESDFDNVGTKIRFDTVFIDSNPKLNAIGNAMRSSVFKAIVGKENYELFSEIKDTACIYGKKFKCFVDQKEDPWDNFRPIKNTFKKFECILDSQGKKDMFEYLSNILHGKEIEIE